MKKSNLKIRFVHAVLVFLNPLARLSFRIHTFVTKQQRARVAIINEENQILLVKNTLGSLAWTLPGGGIEKSELPIEAAARELHEELTIDIPIDDLIFAAKLDPSQIEGLRYTAVIFYANVKKANIHLENYDFIEIKDVNWFDITTLPSDTTKLVRSTVEMVAQNTIN